MSKHIADKAHMNSGKRLQKYVSIERSQSGTHLHILKLQQRRRDRCAGAKRATEYARIERGIPA